MVKETSDYHESQERGYLREEGRDCDHRGSCRVSGMLEIFYFWPWVAGTQMWFYANSFCCYCFFFRAKPAAYWSSQAMGWTGTVAASHSHSHSSMESDLHLPPIPQLMTRSLTHWVRPGMELSSSWILFGFVTAKPQQELPRLIL